MKKILALALLAFAAPALAATTWTTDVSQDKATVRVSLATCTTGTESAPADGVGASPNQKGLDLYKIRGLTIQVSAAAAMTAGGTLQAYYYNPITTKWHRAPDLDLTVAAVQYQTFSGFEVVSDWSRVLWVPNGVGQAVNIYIVGRIAALPR